jgi:hypothetical protein
MFAYLPANGVILDTNEPGVVFGTVDEKKVTGLQLVMEAVWVR